MSDPDGPGVDPGVAGVESSLVPTDGLGPPQVLQTSASHPGLGSPSIIELSDGGLFSSEPTEVSLVLSDPSSRPRSGSVPATDRDRRNSAPYQPHRGRSRARLLGLDVPRVQPALDPPPPPLADPDMDISGGDPPSNIQERFEKLEELSQGMERMFHQINEGTSRDLADLKHASEAGVQLARDESRADRKALQEQMDTRFTDLTGNCRTLETAVNDNAAGVARDIAALQAGVVTVGNNITSLTAACTSMKDGMNLLQVGLQDQIQKAIADGVRVAITTITSTLPGEVQTLVNQEGLKLSQKMDASNSQLRDDLIITQTQFEQEVIRRVEDSESAIRLLGATGTPVELDALSAVDRRVTDLVTALAQRDAEISDLRTDLDLHRSTVAAPPPILDTDHQDRLDALEASQQDARDKWDAERESSSRRIKLLEEAAGKGFSDSTLPRFGVMGQGEEGEYTSLFGGESIPDMDELGEMVLPAHSRIRLDQYLKKMVSRHGSDHDKVEQVRDLMDQYDALTRVSKQYLSKSTSLGTTQIQPSGAGKEKDKAIHAGPLACVDDNLPLAWPENLTPLALILKEVVATVESGNNSLLKYRATFGGTGSKGIEACPPVTRCHYGCKASTYFAERDERLKYLNHAAFTDASIMELGKKMTSAEAKAAFARATVSGRTGLVSAFIFECEYLDQTGVTYPGILSEVMQGRYIKPALKFHAPAQGFLWSQDQKKIALELRKTYYYQSVNPEINGNVFRGCLSVFPDITLERIISCAFKELGLDANHVTLATCVEYFDGVAKAALCMGAPYMYRERPRLGGGRNNPNAGGPPQPAGGGGQPPGHRQAHGKDRDGKNGKGKGRDGDAKGKDGGGKKKDAKGKGKRGKVPQDSPGAVAKGGKNNQQGGHGVPAAPGRALINCGLGHTTQVHQLHSACAGCVAHILGEPPPDVKCEICSETHLHGSLQLEDGTKIALCPKVMTDRNPPRDPNLVCRSRVIHRCGPCGLFRKTLDRLRGDREAAAKWLVGEGTEDSGLLKIAKIVKLATEFQALVETARQTEPGKRTDGKKKRFSKLFEWCPTDCEEAAPAGNANRKAADGWGEGGDWSNGGDWGGDWSHDNYAQYAPNEEEWSGDYGMRRVPDDRDDRSVGRPPLIGTSSGPIRLVYDVSENLPTTLEEIEHAVRTRGNVAPDPTPGVPTPERRDRRDQGRERLTAMFPGVPLYVESEDRCFEGQSHQSPQFDNSSLLGPVSPIDPDSTPPGQVTPPSGFISAVEPPTPPRFYERPLAREVISDMDDEDDTPTADMTYIGMLVDDSPIPAIDLVQLEELDDIVRDAPRIGTRKLPLVGTTVMPTSVPPLADWCMDDDEDDWAHPEFRAVESDSGFDGSLDPDSGKDSDRDTPVLRGLPEGIRTFDDLMLATQFDPDDGEPDVRDEPRPVPTGRDVPRTFGPQIFGCPAAIAGEDWCYGNGCRFHDSGDSDDSNPGYWVGSGPRQRSPPRATPVVQDESHSDSQGYDDRLADRLAREIHALGGRDPPRDTIVESCLRGINRISDRNATTDRVSSPAIEGLTNTALGATGPQTVPGANLATRPFSVPTVQEPSSVSHLVRWGSSLSTIEGPVREAGPTSVLSDTDLRPIPGMDGCFFRPSETGATFLEDLQRAQQHSGMSAVEGPPAVPVVGSGSRSYRNTSSGQRPTQIGPGNSVFVASQRVNLVPCYFVKKNKDDQGKSLGDTIITVWFLPDTGCTVSTHTHGNNLINSKFADYLGIPVVVVKDKQERVQVGSSSAQVEDFSLKFCVLDPMFMGLSVSLMEPELKPVWGGDSRGFHIPAGKYLGQQLGRGVVAMCVDWMHQDDSWVMGEATMDRLKFALIGDGRHYQIQVRDLNGKDQLLWVEKGIRGVCNPFFKAKMPDSFLPAIPRPPGLPPTPSVLSGSATSFTPKAKGAPPKAKTPGTAKVKASPKPKGVSGLPQFCVNLAPVMQRSGPPAIKAPAKTLTVSIDPIRSSKVEDINTMIKAPAKTLTVSIDPNRSSKVTSTKTKPDAKKPKPPPTKSKPPPTKSKPPPAKSTLYEAYIEEVSDTEDVGIQSESYEQILQAAGDHHLGGDIEILARYDSYRVTFDPTHGADTSDPSTDYRDARDGGPDRSAMGKTEGLVYDFVMDEGSTKSLRTGIDKAVNLKDLDGFSDRLYGDGAAGLVSAILVLILRALLVAAGIAIPTSLLAGLSELDGVSVVKEMFMGVDMGKGFLQWAISMRLRHLLAVGTNMPGGPGAGRPTSFTLLCRRLSLGIAWAPAWFQAHTDRMLGGLRDLSREALLSAEKTFVSGDGFADLLLGTHRSAGVEQFHVPGSNPLDDIPDPVIVPTGSSGDLEYAAYSEESADEKLNIELAAGDTRFAAAYIDDGNWRSGRTPLRVVVRWLMIILGAYVFSSCYSLKKVAVGERLDVLGFLITADPPSKKVSPGKAQGLWDWPKLESQKAAVQFLATASWNREFVGDWLTVTEPIQLDANRKVAKGDKWVLSPAGSLAFDKIKDAVARDVELRPIDEVAALQWWSTGGALKFSIDGSRIGGSVVGMQKQSGTNRIVWHVTKRWSVEERASNGCSSVRIELQSLKLLCVKVLPGIPVIYDIFIYSDSSCLGPKELNALLGLGIVRLRATRSLAWECLEILNSRKTHRIGISGKANIAANAGSRQWSPDMIESREDLIRDINDAFNLDAGSGFKTHRSMQDTVNMLELTVHYLATPDICRCIVPGTQSRMYILKLRPGCPLVKPGTETPGVISPPIQFSVEVIFPDDSLIARDTPGVFSYRQLALGVPIEVYNPFHESTPDRRITPALLARNINTSARDPVITAALTLLPQQAADDKQMTHGELPTYHRRKLGTDAEQDAEIKEREKKMHERVSDSDFHREVGASLWMKFGWLPLITKGLMVKVALVFLNVFWGPGRPFPTQRYAAYHRPTGSVPGNSRFFTVGPAEFKALFFLLREACYETYLQLWNTTSWGVPALRSSIFLALRKGSALGRLIMDAIALNLCFLPSLYPIPTVPYVLESLLRGTGSDPDQIVALMRPPSLGTTAAICPFTSPIKVVGEFLDTPGWLVHQCNCISSTPAGLAAAVFKRFPIADVYSSGANRQQFPGYILVVPGSRVVNLFGQLYPGHPGRRDTAVSRYTAFNVALGRLSKFIRLASQSADWDPSGELGAVVSFPARIGSGMAGGRWSNYRHLIVSWAQANRHIKVQVVYDPIFFGPSMDSDYWAQVEQGLNVHDLGKEENIDREVVEGTEGVDDPSPTNELEPQARPGSRLNGPKDPAPAQTEDCPIEQLSTANGPEPKARPKGRPKGSKNKPKGIESVLEPAEGPEVPGKQAEVPGEPKPRGRPKGSKNKPKGIESVLEPAEGPGVPGKQAEVPGEPKPRGRPKGSKNKASEKETTVGKQKKPKHHRPKPKVMLLPTQVPLVELLPAPSPAIPGEDAPSLPIDRDALPPPIVLGEDELPPTKQELSRDTRLALIRQFLLTLKIGENSGRIEPGMASAIRADFQQDYPHHVSMGAVYYWRAPGETADTTPSTTAPLGTYAVGLVRLTEEKHMLDLIWRLASETVLTGDLLCAPPGTRYVLFITTSYAIKDTISPAFREKLLRQQPLEYAAEIETLMAAVPDRPGVAAKLVKTAGKQKQLVALCNAGRFKICNGLLTKEIYRGHFCVLLTVGKPPDDLGTLLEAAAYFHNPGQAQAHLQQLSVENLVLAAGLYHLKLTRAVRQVIRFCLVCQVSSHVPPQLTLHPPSVPGSPGIRIIIDFIEKLARTSRGNTAVFTGSDNDSEFTFLRATPGTSTIDAVDGMVGILQVEPYQIIRSDNGSAFGPDFQASVVEFTEDVGYTVKFEMGRAARPEGQSHGEGPHCPVNRLLRLGLAGLPPYYDGPEPEPEEYPVDWDQNVPRTAVMINYVLSYHDSTRGSVHNARDSPIVTSGATTFGGPGGFGLSPLGGIHIEAEIRQTIRRGRMNQVQRNRNKRQEQKELEAADTRVNDAEYTAGKGDFVVRLRTQRTKFQTKYRMMVYIVRDVEPRKWVDLERLDGRAYYGLNRLDVRQVKKVLLTAGGIHGFLVGSGLTGDELKRRYEQVLGWTNVQGYCKKSGTDPLDLPLGGTGSKATPAKLSWNVDGLLPMFRNPVKLDLLMQTVRQQRPGLIFLQETKLRETTVGLARECLLVALPDYDPHFNHCDAEVRKGYSGTCVLVHKDLASATTIMSMRVSPKHLAGDKDESELAEFDREGRVQLVQHGAERTLGIYAVNAKKDLSRLAIKAEWYRNLGRLVRGGGITEVVGDFNGIWYFGSPFVHPRFLRDQHFHSTPSCTIAERDMLHNFAREAGLVRVRKGNREFSFRPFVGPLGFDLDYLFRRPGHDTELTVITGDFRDHQILLWSGGESTESTV